MICSWLMTHRSLSAASVFPGQSDDGARGRGGEESSRVTMPFCIPIAPNLERLFAIVPPSRLVAIPPSNVDAHELRSSSRR